MLMKFLICNTRSLMELDTSYTICKMKESNLTLLEASIWNKLEPIIKPGNLKVDK